MGRRARENSKEFGYFSLGEPVIRANGHGGCLGKRIRIVKLFVSEGPLEKAAAEAGRDTNQRDGTEGQEERFTSKPSKQPMHERSGPLENSCELAYAEAVLFVALRNTDSLRRAVCRTKQDLKSLPEPVHCRNSGHWMLSFAQNTVERKWPRKF